ncbi:MAG TPA: hypothetical protein VKU87_07790 [Thermomicrobiaceae bacterium]|nr:hypothetical protein [Thermomicrobiaceae bacterium]
MDTLTVCYSWPGIDIDVLRLYIEPRRDNWEAAFVNGNPEVALLYAGEGEQIDQLAAVEIVGFSTFAAWDDLPDLPLRWRLAGEAPMTLRQLIRELQTRLVPHVEATARSGR